MKEQKRNELPLLPLRGMIVYPSMVVHLDVGREKSVRALEEAMVEDSQFILAAQKDTNSDDPSPEDIYQTGTIATIKQMVKLPNGTRRILVEGEERAKILSFNQSDSYLKAEYTELEEEHGDNVEEQAMVRMLINQFEEYMKVSKKLNQETFETVKDIKDGGHLADIITSHLPLPIHHKQNILEYVYIPDRLDYILQLLHNEKEVLTMERKIGQRVRKSMERTQKEYYLREQLKAIQKELGEQDGKTGEVQQLREKIEEANMPERITQVANKELDRYEKVPQSSAESSVIRN